MARPKVVVAAALTPQSSVYIPPSSIRPSVRPSLPKSGVLETLLVVIVAEFLSLSLWPPSLIFFAIFAFLLPRIMLGIRPYCGEGLLCIFVADEGEKRGEGRIRIYSGDEEVMERSGKY